MGSPSPLCTPMAPMRKIFIAMPWDTAAIVPPSCFAASSRMTLVIRSWTSPKLSQPGTNHLSGSLLKRYICSGHL